MRVRARVRAECNGRKTKIKEEQKLNKMRPKLENWGMKVGKRDKAEKRRKKREEMAVRHTMVQNNHESRCNYWATHLFVACSLTHSLPSLWESER